MNEPVSRKRLQVRLKATDSESLARSFGPSLGEQSVYLKAFPKKADSEGGAPGWAKQARGALPHGTHVSVEIALSQGTRVLAGQGHVAEVLGDEAEPGGMIIALQWDAASRPLLKWVLERTRALSGPVSSGGPPVPPDRPTTEYSYSSSSSSVHKEEIETLPQVPDALNARSVARKRVGNSIRRPESKEVTPLARLELVSQSLEPTPRTKDLPELGLDREGADSTSSEAASGPRGTPALGPKTGPTIGIDFGSANVRAALHRDQKTELIPSRRGTPAIPAWVLMESGGKITVGEPAKRRAALKPNNTLTNFKYLMGRTYAPDVAKSLPRDAFSLSLEAGDDGRLATRIGTEQISFEDTAGFLLSEVREGASLALRQSVNRAALGCPAWFSSGRRASLFRAATKAGFHVERMVSDALAAAVAYGSHDATERKMGVCDLGGTFFGFSVVGVSRQRFELLASKGDPRLGGRAFDAPLISLFVQDLEDTLGPSVSEDPHALALIREAGEEAKQVLQTIDRTTVRVERLLGTQKEHYNFEMEVFRSQVETEWRALVDQMIGCAQSVCEEAGVRPGDLDQLLIIGGHSKEPLLVEGFSEAFGLEDGPGAGCPEGAFCRRGATWVAGPPVQPADAVALGLGMLASGLGKEDAPELVERLATGVGIGLGDGEVEWVFSPGTVVPASRFHALPSAALEGGPDALLLLHGGPAQGDRRQLLGKLRVHGLDDVDVSKLLVVLRLSLDESGLLSVSARDEKRDIPLEVTVEPPTVPSPSPSQSPNPTADVTKPRSSRLVGWLRKTLGSDQETV